MRGLVIGVIFTMLVTASADCYALFWKKAALWNVMDPFHRVTVCWVPNETRPFWAEKGIVRQVVEQIWGFVGNVSFNGWEDCPFGIVKAIVVTQEDYYSYTPGLGMEMFGPMRLNFRYQRAGADFAAQNAVCSGSFRSTCIRSTAIHEFGHALGFDHEFDRPDSPVVGSTCQRTFWNSGADAWSPNFDVMSVMNYEGGCGGRRLALTLSADDILGIIMAYGIGRRYVAAINAALWSYNTGPW